MISLCQTRKIRPTRRSISGIYAFRGEISVPFESSLERDFLIRTEFNRFVLNVIPQPVQIPFSGRNGQSYTYTPDFLVYFRANGSGQEHKPLLVEVKPAAIWREHWRDWSAKWKSARRYAIDQGWIFRIADESRIRDQVLANINALNRYTRTFFSEDQRLAMIDHVRHCQVTTAGDLAASCFGPDQQDRAMAAIWHLVAMRDFECQMDAPLTEQTTLWIASHE